jgi:hypothetical protein
MAGSKTFGPYLDDPDGYSRSTLRRRRIISSAHHGPRGFKLFNECEVLAGAVGLDCFAEGEPVTRVSFKEYPLRDSYNIIFDTPS